MADAHKRGGQEPPPQVEDRPEQNIGYDEAVKGAPLTPDERRKAERESPLGGGEELSSENDA
jgi:hypothetical protein